MAELRVNNGKRVTRVVVRLMDQLSGGFLRNAWSTRLASDRPVKESESSLGEKALSFGVEEECACAHVGREVWGIKWFDEQCPTKACGSLYAGAP